MNFNNIKLSITQLVNKISFMIKKSSPETLLVLGIAAAGGSILLAVKSTLKLENTIKKSNDEIKVIKDRMDDDNKVANGEVNIHECKKELVRAYARSILNVSKLYMPSAILFGAGVSSLLGSHRILKGRNVALAAAYATLDTGYKNYRERVAKKIGETAEKKIFRNEYEEEEEVKTIDKDGNEKITTKKSIKAHMDKDSDHSYLFDASNPNWERNGKMNMDWLLHKEKYLNMKLTAKGYIFLHEVYDELGIEPGMIGDKKLQASRILGWIYNPNDTSRDNYISFGLSDAEGNLKKSSMDLLRNNETEIWLDFNIDGDILTGDSGKETFMKRALSV